MYATVQRKQVSARMCPHGGVRGRLGYRLAIRPFAPHHARASLHRTIQDCGGQLASRRTYSARASLFDRNVHSRRGRLVQIAVVRVTRLYSEQWGVVLALLVIAIVIGVVGLLRLDTPLLAVPPFGVAVIVGYFVRRYRSFDTTAFRSAADLPVACLLETSGRLVVRLLLLVTLGAGVGSAVAILSEYAAPPIAGLTVGMALAEAQLGIWIGRYETQDNHVFFTTVRAVPLPRHELQVLYGVSRERAST